MLTNGDTNIRLGTLYFKRLGPAVRRTYYALASYNAGENRVVRWKAERPGMDEDEFIDDIPFPETQNYVKRDPRHGRGLSPALRRRRRSPQPGRERDRLEEAHRVIEQEEGAGRRRRRRAGRRRARNEIDAAARASTDNVTTS